MRLAPEAPAEGLDVGGAADFVAECGAGDDLLPADRAAELVLDTDAEDVDRLRLAAGLGAHR